MDVAGGGVSHKAFDATAGFDSDPPLAVARRFLRNKQHDNPGVSPPVTDAGTRTNPPRSSYSQRDVRYVPTRKVTHSDDRHLAASLRADLERDPVQPIDFRLIEYPSRVNDNFGGTRPVPARGWGNFQLLAGGYEECEK